MAYLYKIFLTFPPTLKVLKIWSDGPSSQFKNKYIAAIILYFEQKFKIKIFWNFFATAHGKASVDGLGAVVKKKVKELVLSQERIVYNADDFVDAFRSSESKVDVFALSPKEIEEINIELNLSDLTSKAPAIRGISECHQLQVVNNSVKGFIISKEGYKYD